MPFCLPKHIVDNFLAAIKDGTLDPIKMMDMNPDVRHTLLAGILGEDNATKANALYESKLLLKDQQRGLITWIKNVGGLTPKREQDMISRVNKMEKILTPENKDAFLKDLARQKLGVTVTMDEAANISELAKMATEKKEVMKKGEKRIGVTAKATKTEMEYGIAAVEFRDYLRKLKKGPVVEGKPVVQAVYDLLLQAGADPSGTFLVAAGITKTLKTVWDNSVLLRQGWKVLMSHPAIWEKQALGTFKDMYNTIGGKPVMKEIDAWVLSHPLYDDMVRDRLAITVVEEEIPEAQLIEMIPIIGTLAKAAENAFTGFAYKNRVDLYCLYTEIANKSGYTNTKDMGIGRLVNSLTSRGALGRLEPFADILNVTFFSIRNLKANFDILTAHLLDKKVSWFVRKQAAINLLKIVSGTAAVLALASAMGADVEWDPRSPDFGKFRIGNTRFDVSGGMSSIVVLAARLISGAMKSSTTGKISPIRGEKALWTDGKDLVTDFFGNKLAPIFSVGSNIILTGRTFNGDKISVANTVNDLIMPLQVDTGIEMWKDPDSAPLLLGLIAEFLGIGTQTYGPKKSVGFGK